MVLSPSNEFVRPGQGDLIEHAFNIFGEQQETMCEVGFAKFCKCTHKIQGPTTSAIFSSVVQDKAKGMNLNEFKTALGLLVSSGEHCTNSKAAAKKILKSSAQGSGRVLPESRRAQKENLPAAASATNQIEERLPSSATRQSARKLSRTIRWCPADLDSSLDA